ncbi:MAG: LicD family protein [Vicinamibacteria bacterium]|nr:LicD family protein [Vicinamibacteria bacterium]
MIALKLLTTLILILILVVVLLLGLTPLLDRFRRTVLRRILVDVTDVLNRHDIEYWADFGTLLGLIRQGDIILGDKDVDLCVLDAERPRVMAAYADFAARGYWLTGEGGAAGKLMRVFDLRSPFYADIYPYLANGETVASVLDPRDDAPTRLVSAKENVAFRGALISTPREAEPLLEYRYGPSFRIPRRNDKGRAGGAGPWHSLSQDLEASALFVWFFLRYALGVRPGRA